MSVRREVLVEGRRISYLEAGAGSPLVLLHAFPLNAEMWEPQLQAAAPGWRYIAPDLRGFGASEGSAPPTLDEHAADVEGLLRALSIASAVVAGLSMGGYIAFALQRRTAAAIRGLVLADTRPQADSDEGRDNRRKMQAVAREGGAAAVADQMLPKLLAPATHRDRPDVVALVRALILRTSPDAIVAALEGMMWRPDATPQLGAMRCPALIVVGALDELTPKADSERMHEAIDGSELAVLKGAGHLSNLERPADFNAALARFLSARFPREGH